MSIEKNKELVRDFTEVVPTDTNDIDRITDQYIAPDFIAHFPEVQVPGLEGAKQYGREFYRAFPDAKAVVKDMVAEGDKVAVRSVTTGTHKGEYLGFSPTGKSFSIEYFEIYRVANGKIVEYWGTYDKYDMLVQLGIISEAEAA